GRRQQGCLNQQPAVGVVVCPLLPIALIAPALGNFADAIKGQVERRLSKLLHEVASVIFVTRGRQLVMDCQAHIVSLAFILRCHGQFVTHEMALAAQNTVAAAARAFTTLRPT
ncbi:MAG: hypothetical protein NT154_44520, partial [Verrucomicrobia bacterium]|nr:hypothetical protein [Verrucomicrobiota bacterium]